MRSHAELYRIYDEIHQRLLNWYDQHQRALPWRALPGQLANPYHVFLSEIMLQQTTVTTVKDYFKEFIKKWPTIYDLAAASLDEILHLWQGLGYYARARNLHKCAYVVAHEMNGIFPEDEKTLLTLPGIGPYTAAAISAIAYDQPTIAIDGNVIRVFARLFQIETPLPKLKNLVTKQSHSMIPSKRSGDFTQALMDLGATVCRPQKPDCPACPLISMCLASKNNLSEFLPIKSQKPQKPTLYGTAFFTTNNKQQILLRKRPAKGLLGGLWEIPTSDWAKDVPSQFLSPEVKHTFTHFHLRLNIIKTQSNEEGVWVHPKDLEKYALPTLMKKVIKAALI